MHHLQHCDNYTQPDIADTLLLDARLSRSLGSNVYDDRKCRIIIICRHYQHSAVSQSTDWCVDQLIAAAAADADDDDR